MKSLPVCRWPYLSAFLALRQAAFRTGQSVLAPGVGGSVGNATLKVARALGASQLVSTAGSPAKESAAADDGLREVGILNLQRESLADGLARLAPGGVDIVIDALGGPLTGQAVAGLARGGRVVVVGYAAGTETTTRVTDLVWKLAHVSGFSLFAASAEEQAAAYAAVLPLIASGQIAPAHDRSFPLEQAPEALRHLIEDRPFGTVTLTVGPLPFPVSQLVRSATGSAAAFLVRFAVCGAGQGPMKSSSAWLTSSAWVQMIACGPPATTMERAFFSNAGSLRLVAS